MSGLLIVYFCTLYHKHDRTAHSFRCISCWAIHTLIFFPHLLTVPSYNCVCIMCVVCVCVCVCHMYVCVFTVCVA